MMPAILFTLTLLVCGYHWRASLTTHLVSILHILGTIAVQLVLALVHLMTQMDSVNTQLSETNERNAITAGFVTLAISGAIAHIRNRNSTKKAERMMDNAAYLDAEMRRRSDHYYEGQ